MRWPGAPLVLAGLLWLNIGCSSKHEDSSEGLDGGAGGTSSAADPTIEMPLSIAFDPSVPEPARASIIAVDTPFSAGDLGSPLAVPLVTGGAESIVLASDANGDIVLASLVTADHATLSASSTALVFARLALGVLPSNQSPAAVNSAISGAKGFPDLVNSVGRALDAGNSPMRSAEVMQSLSVTVVQALVSQSGPASGLPKASRELGLANPTVPAASSGYQVATGVTVTGTGAAGALQLKNIGPLAWEVSSEALNGAQLDHKYLSANNLGFENVILSLFLPGLVPTLGLKGGLPKLNLFVEQDSKTHGMNLLGITTDIVSLGLRWTGVGNEEISECLPAVVPALLGFDPLQIPASLSVEQAKDSLKSGFLSANPENIGKALGACLKKTSPIKFAARFLSRLNGFFLAKEALGAAWDTATLLARVGLTWSEWNTSKTVGVCEEGGKLVDCREEPDAGVPDAGSLPDAGAPVGDAGTPDAGLPAQDAGVPPDAGAPGTVAPLTADGDSYLGITPWICSCRITPYGPCTPSDSAPCYYQSVCGSTPNVVAAYLLPFYPLRPSVPESFTCGSAGDPVGCGDNNLCVGIATITDPADAGPKRNSWCMGIGKPASGHCWDGPTCSSGLVVDGQCVDQ